LRLRPAGRIFRRRLVNRAPPRSAKKGTLKS
jgi:hypothetical protein